jgi:hypothetical protein
MNKRKSPIVQFWPIHDRYTAELATITDTKYALLKDTPSDQRPGRNLHQGASGCGEFYHAAPLEISPDYSESAIGEIDGVVLSDRLAPRLGHGLAVGLANAFD